ncbi:MAG: hypothetical protein QOD42_1981 [Sphingomonadales bacterium]|jgi:hypothetical protein|nr:hypothetical protein [Sphingomonadales bacterium]
MTIVQIPCLSCRVGTPVEDGVATVSCAACGAALPAPAARAWMLLRGGSQQFGPYAIAEVARFLGEGRLQLSDEIWHEGAALRLALHRLPASTLPQDQAAPQAQSAPEPPAGARPEPKAESAAAPAPAAATAPATQPEPAPVQPAPVAPALAFAPERASAGERIKLHLVRALSWNLRSLTVEPDEEARLLATGVDEADARRYLVWRRSVLLVVALPMLISALLATIGWGGRDRSSLSDLGGLLEIVQLAALYALPITAWLAAWSWDRHRRSRNILLRGWLIAFLMPLVLALVPFAWRFDFSNADPTQVDNVMSGFGLIGAIVAYVTLMPAVLSLIPGVLRGCLRIKALIPESILPGLFLIAAAPLYILFFLVIFTTVNQVAGNLVLILAVLALLMAPLLYLFNAGTFTRPLRTPEEVAKVGQVQTTAMIILGIGLGLLVIYAFTATIFGKSLVGMDEATSLMRPWSPSLFQLPLEYFVRSLFTTVLVADLFMLMNLSLWRHTQAFQASPEAQSYDRLMTEIEEAGS